jgi:hypothetical protein
VLAIRTWGLDEQEPEAGAFERMSEDEIRAWLREHAAV